MCSQGVDVAVFKQERRIQRVVNYFFEFLTHAQHRDRIQPEIIEGNTCLDFRHWPVEAVGNHVAQMIAEARR